MIFLSYILSVRYVNANTVGKSEESLVPTEGHRKWCQTTVECGHHGFSLAELQTPSSLYLLAFK